MYGISFFDVDISNNFLRFVAGITWSLYLFKVGSINSIFYFLHKAAEPFNCLEQDNLA